MYISRDYKYIYSFIGKVINNDGLANITILEYIYGGEYAYIEAYTVEENESGYFYMHPTEEEARKDFNELKEEIENLLAKDEIYYYDLYYYHCCEIVELRSYYPNEKLIGVGEVVEAESYIIDDFKNT